MNFGPMSLGYKSLQIRPPAAHLASVVSTAPSDPSPHRGEAGIRPERGMSEKHLPKIVF